MLGLFMRIVLVAICLHVVHDLKAQASESRRSPNCINSGPVGFQAFAHVCGVVKTGPKKDILDRMPMEERLDLVETCSCALLNHELTWASMVTREVDGMYLAIKKLIDDTDDYLISLRAEPKDEVDKTRIEALKEQYDNHIQIESEVKKTDLPLISLGDDGEKLYYWDRLTQIVNKRGKDENKEDKIAAHVQRNFGLVLYEPENMSYKLAKGVKLNSMLVSPSIKEQFSKACWQLLSDFRPIAAYFNNLGQLASNPKMFFDLATYNDNLYKLRMTTLMCKFLEQKHKLSAQGEATKKYKISKASSNHVRGHYIDPDDDDDDDYEDYDDED